MVVLSCRFYKEKYPEVSATADVIQSASIYINFFQIQFAKFAMHFVEQIDDVVMVNVRAIAEMGAYVYLLEYNNIEGMILLSELSRRRIRSINKLIRVGKTEPVVVIRVDKEKGEWIHFVQPIRFFSKFPNLNLIFNPIEFAQVTSICRNVEYQLKM